MFSFLTNLFAKSIPFTPEEITQLETKGFKLSTDKTKANYYGDEPNMNYLIEERNIVKKTNKYFECESSSEIILSVNFLHTNEIRTYCGKKANTLEEVLTFFVKGYKATTNLES